MRRSRFIMNMYTEKVNRYKADNGGVLENMQLNKKRDSTFDIITIQGSEAFVILYHSALKNMLNSRNVEVHIRYHESNAHMEISLKSDLFNPTLRCVIKALKSVLKNDSVTMSDMTSIRYNKYTLKVSGDIIDAIQRGMEITYIMHYELSEKCKLPDEIKQVALKLIAIKEDTCASYFHDNTLIVDRYHCPTRECPLQADIVYDLFSTGDYIISEFENVRAIECEIKGTGNIID